MDHSLTQTGNVATLSLAGALTYEWTASYSAMVRSIGAMRPKHLILDLTEVPTIDTTGVQALMVLKRTMEQFGGEVHVRGLQRPVLRAIELCGATKTFTSPRDRNTHAAHP
ncbi:STAS domain-containing protein [Azospirillum sp. sgz302134]